jgi:hypothetical protein
MQYMPSVMSLKYLDGAALGKKHVGILYGDIKSDGLVQYLFIFHIYYRFKVTVQSHSDIDLVCFESGQIRIR